MTCGPPDTGVIEGLVSRMRFPNRMEDSPSPVPLAVAPLVTHTGTNSHVLDERCLRITTQAEWSALWLEHVGEPPKPQCDMYFNKAGLPVVDFERCMVMAVFGGATNNVAGLSATAPATPGDATPGG
jgi:hypothetical protein